MSYRKFNFADGVKAQYSSAWMAEAKDYADQIVKSPNVGETEQSGTLPNIVNLFSERFEELSKILRFEWGFHSVGKIREIRKNRSTFKQKNINLIGMVCDVRRTKSGGRMLEMEDKTGRMSVFVPKEHPAIDTLLPDDVIGITGKYMRAGEDFFIASRVQYPEVADYQNRGGDDFDPVSVAFTSDVHFGSKYHLTKEWGRMMDWLNSEHTVAKNIKYLVCSGDMADGIGVYPGQDNNLSITDVYDQYEYCARQFDLLPDHITPIMLPGNHDVVRPAEPQPVLESEIQKMFSDCVHMGNPARISLNHGGESDPFEILSYHGKGIDDMVPRMAHVTYEKPAEAMKEMLKKRHLAPMWGERNALSPEETDQMVINRKPDLMVTGHTHAHQMEWYRGTPLVVSSTFQGQSDFMRMLGYKPKMGYLSVYNLQNREMKCVGFADQNNPSAGYSAQQ